MSSTPNSKKDVSKVQEMLERMSTASPTAELVQVEEVVNDTKPLYRVAVDAAGTGETKDEAKMNAAKVVLENLVGETKTSAIPSQTCNGIGMDLRSPTSDSRLPENPIGILQEMCMAKRWPAPSYELVSEQGMPHQRDFTIACVLCSYTVLGKGSSKKVAKHQAALNMWRKVQEVGPNLQAFVPSPQSLVSSQSENLRLSQVVQDDSILSRYAHLKSRKIANLNPGHSLKVREFYANLKANKGLSLTELQNVQLVDSEFNYVKFLEEIRREQVFEVTYVNINEESVTGEHQCIVQLSTLPVAVCHGTGNSTKNAQQSAARNALEYLRIMTKN